MQPTETPAPVHVGIVHYRVVAAIGLALMALGLYQQNSPEIATIFLIAFGTWMILFPRPRMPLLFVILMAVIELVSHRGAYNGFPDWLPFVPFEPTTLLLSCGIVLFLGCEYRLISIRWHVVPYDPRFSPRKGSEDGERLIAPQTRPEAALTPEEIVRFVAFSAGSVLLAQWFWSWLDEPRWLGGFSPRLVQIFLIIWLVVVGMFVVGGLAGYWRRAHSDPATARLYLQEVAWSEARREYGRIGRWLAWGKRKK